MQEITTRQTPKTEEEHHHQFASPSSTASQKKSQTQKRKRLLLCDPYLDEQTPSKRPRASSESHEQVAEHSNDPVAHWVLTEHWPKAFGEVDLRMNQGNSSKRESSSVHYADRLERLAENGIYMRASALMERSSKDLCHKFLAGDRTPSRFPCYPPEQIFNVIDRIYSLNEARVQRDVTPWVVPSAENLYFSGETIPDYIGEEIQAEWTGCATMGSTRPKPTYTAGLLRSAFTEEEIKKLQNYASFERLFSFTPNLCFPFLMCEAKAGVKGTDEADLQNLHSASIAVRAIIELYKAAFGTKDPARVNGLYGQVLAFSVSHNSRQVNLYGHYAVLGDDSARTLKFDCYDIDIIGLTMNDGDDKYKPYNFILNIYETFAQKFREMIKTAVAFLSLPAKRTGLSFAASDLALEEMDSQQDFRVDTSQDDRVFKTPTEPASVSQKEEMAKIREQLDREREKRDQIAKIQQKTDELQKQIDKRQKQIEEQRDWERKENRKKEEKMEDQTAKLQQQTGGRQKQFDERQKQFNEQQKQIEERHKEIISLLKQALT